MSYIFIFLVSLNLLDSLNANRLKKGELLINVFDTFDQCDGPDTGNYTALTETRVSLDCSPITSNDINGEQYLIKDYSTVNTLRNIQRLRVNIGESSQILTVALVMSGNLEGKFIMFKQFSLAQQLSKCVSTNNAFGKKLTINKVTILISDKFIPAVFLASDAWGEFKKGSTTICQGRQYAV